jgi:predicted lipoprotein
MRRNWLAGFVLGIGLLLNVNLLAHHSESAEYDATKPVKVTGTIKKVEWQNRRIWFYVDVKDESGKVTTWGFSGGPRECC